MELNSHGSLSKDGCGSFECSDSGMTDALLNSKVDMVSASVLCYRNRSVLTLELLS